MPIPDLRLSFVPRSRRVRGVDAGASRGMDISTNILAILGVFGVIAVVVVTLATIRAQHNTIWIVGGMLMASALATHSTETGYINNTWLRIIQERRAEFYLGLGCLLFVLNIPHLPKFRINTLSAQGLCLLAINLYAGALDMVHMPGTLDGLMRIGLMLITMPAVMVAMGTMLNDWSDFQRAMRGLGFVGAAWVGAVIIQLFIDHRQLILAGTVRFTGLLGNPQATAVFVGPMATILAWLAFNDNDRRMRWFWIASSVAMTVMVLWTGSRTGTLMYLVGLTAVLHTRLGRAVFLLPLAAAGVYGMLQLIESMGISLGLERLTSGLDTRTDAWRMLLEDAMNAPLFGGGGAAARKVENSFLLGMVIYGVFMLALILLLMVINGVQCLRLLNLRRRAPGNVQRLIDVIIAYNLIYFMGAFFEWIVLSRVDGNFVFIMAFGAMTTRLLQIARTEEFSRMDSSPDGWSAGRYGEWADIAESYGDSRTGDSRTGGDESLSASR